MRGFMRVALLASAVVASLGGATAARGSSYEGPARHGVRLGIGATMGAMASNADRALHGEVGWSWGLGQTHSAEIGVRAARQRFHASGLDAPMENLGLTSFGVRLLFLGDYEGGRKGAFWMAGAEVLVMEAQWIRDVGSRPFAPADIRRWAGTTGGGGLILGLGLSSRQRVEFRAEMAVLHLASLPETGRAWYSPFSLTALLRL